jgi:hypothetical protein
MSILGEAGSITTTWELASSTASRRESRVVVTQATAEPCARLGPFGFAQGRLAKAPVPART